MKVKKEEIKQWINDVYTKLRALLSLYGETDGFNKVPEGEAEEDPQEFIRRKIGEISEIEQNFSLYMDKQEIAEVKKLKPRLMDLDPGLVGIDPEVREISDKLRNIISDTWYFFYKHVIQQEAQGFAFLWGAINPHLTYFDRIFKFLGIHERGQRIGIGLSHKFHRTGVGQLLEQVDELGHVELELLECDARHSDGAAELAAVLLDHPQ